MTSVTSVAPSCMEPRAKEKQANSTLSAASGLRARRGVADASKTDEAVPVPVYMSVNIIICLQTECPEEAPCTGAAGIERERR
mmetsp:Transcript_31444/g.42537  ORF Transcript_31444/g.42537 Transcript_31444/m.42537 type:complete len:83 (+) Transcript_31444:343-591(+)